MKKILVMILVLMFVFGCGKIISPTGPSEAVAADRMAAKSEEGVVATPPTLSFLPSQTSFRVGDKVVVDVVVDNVIDLFGIGATIAFDRSKLEFVKIEEGGFLKQQNPTSIMSAIAGRDPNQLVIGLSSLGHVKGVNGSGSLFRIVFKALSSGPSETKFIDTGLRTPALKEIIFESRSATIVIE